MLLSGLRKFLSGKWSTLLIQIIMEVSRLLHSRITR
jgi:hypothetical protein